MGVQFMSMELKEKIVNIATGEESWRDYTSEEIAEIEKAKIEIEANLAKEAELKAKRQSALIKLQAIGLDENDLKALGL